MEKTYNIIGNYMGVWVEPAGNNTITLKNSITDTSANQLPVYYTLDFSTFNKLEKNETAVINQRAYLYYYSGWRSVGSQTDGGFDIIGNYNIGGVIVNHRGKNEEYHKILPYMNIGKSAQTYLISAKNLVIKSANISSKFKDCVNLVYGPEIKRAGDAYNHVDIHDIFKGCTSLIEIPDITLSGNINRITADSMCEGCTSLIKAPKIKVNNTTEESVILSFVYAFKDCTALNDIPDSLFSSVIDNCTVNNMYCGSMFKGCTSLEKLPVLPTLNSTSSNTINYVSMFEDCSKIKISETETGSYVNEYSINVTGLTSRVGLWDMFTNTGGTFTGTPTINTTYYTSNEVK